MTRRLTHLVAFAVLVIWVVADIPGVRALSASAVLASGALLGALAIVFQGLLRDFAAGLVVLFDDRYAIGDSVDLGGLSGVVVDLGVLSTELRGADNRVMTVPNSGCEPVVNHTKLCSGAELRLPLAPGGLDLKQALEVVRQEVAAFADDSAWQPLLLQAPQVRGVSEVTVDAVWLSAMLTTLAGRHGAARRALLARLVERLGRERIALASSVG
jgi:small conductance mechanosensitive channel